MKFGVIDSGSFLPGICGRGRRIGVLAVNSTLPVVEWNFAGESEGGSYPPHR